MVQSESPCAHPKWANINYITLGKSVVYAKGYVILCNLMYCACADNSLCPRVRIRPQCLLFAIHCHRRSKAQYTTTGDKDDYLWSVRRVSPGGGEYSGVTRAGEAVFQREDVLSAAGLTSPRETLK